MNAPGQCVIKRGNAGSDRAQGRPTCALDQPADWHYDGRGWGSGKGNSYDWCYMARCVGWDVIVAGAPLNNVRGV